VTGWAVVVVGYTICVLVWACYVYVGYRGGGDR
jgi:hypothetical protein